MPDRINEAAVVFEDGESQVLAMDDIGPGGAKHVYRIERQFGKEITWMHTLEFQRGGANEEHTAGFHNEDLLRIVRHRLECFQAGPFACDENAKALDHVIVALATLDKRTEDRRARGVEGKSAA